MDFQTGTVRQDIGSKALEQKVDGKWVPASREIKDAFAADKVTFQHTKDGYHYYSYQFKENRARKFIEAHTSLIFPDLDKVVTDKNSKAGYLVAASGKDATSYKVAEWVWRNNNAIINIITITEPLADLAYDTEAFKAAKTDKEAINIANEYQAGGFDFAYENPSKKAKRIPCKEMDVKTVYDWLLTNMG